MRILVTGGTGFLGRHMLPMLASHDVFAITRGAHNTRTGAHGAHWPENVTWIETDLSQGLDENALPEKMDAVIHLAQSDHYRDFPAGAADVFKVNVDVPAALLRWAAKAGVTQFTAASTGTVYEPFTSTMTEDSALSPTGYYGASKLAAETLSMPYQNAFNVCQLRVFFLYGPGQEGMMIANIIKSVRDGKTLTLPKDNDGLEFVPTYVDDCARVFVTATQDGWSGAYNVAAPYRVTFKQLIDTISNAVGKTAQVERIDAPRPTAIVPDLTKIGAVIDLNQFLTLEQGLQKIVAAE